MACSHAHSLNTVYGGFCAIRAKTVMAMSVRPAKQSDSGPLHRKFASLFTALLVSAWRAPGLQSLADDKQLPSHRGWTLTGTCATQRQVAGRVPRTQAQCGPVIRHPRRTLARTAISSRPSCWLCHFCKHEAPAEFLEGVFPFTFVLGAIKGRLESGVPLEARSQRRITSPNLPNTF